MSLLNHAARLVISLSAIRNNWDTLAKIAQGAECSAVVKADAYGCGMEKVAPALAKAGCKTFFVALPSEGAALRALLKKATIYVFNGLPKGSAAEFKKYDLRPVLNSLNEVKEWCASKNPLPFALHIDTGMNRLGVRAEDLGQLPDCRPELVMSHFVSSEIANDPLNQKQIDIFNVVRALFPNARASLANSSGIFLKQKPFYELVRPGYALYGGNPVPGQKNPMQGVVTLSVPVIQASDVKNGETVGYNAEWTAKRDSRIAVLSLGYADGILRSGFRMNEPGLQVWREGALYPVAGRISMDLITIDVTEAKSPPGRGDSVEIIGAHLPIDMVAEGLRTNGYEVLTSLGRRYERTYI
jgi:alanine racemase